MPRRSGSILSRPRLYATSRHFLQLIAVFGLTASISLSLFAAQNPPPAQPAPVKPPSAHSSAHPAPKHAAPPPAPQVPPEQQLAALARVLHNTPSPTAYTQLSQFARAHAKDLSGKRAALALGYYDLSNGRAADADSWFAKAEGDPLLQAYVTYWHSEADRATGQSAKALSLLQGLLKNNPDLAFSDQLIESLAQDAIAAGQPQAAITALTMYAKTSNKPVLILLRAQAEEQLAKQNKEKPLDAARDYVNIFYGFPLDEEAAPAGARLPELEFALGDQFPTPPIPTQLARAEALFLANKWREAREAYQTLLPKLTGQPLELGTLRVAQCNAQIGSRTEGLASLNITDPDLEAERLYSISQVRRTEKNESEMLALTEQLSMQHPSSMWTEQALFAAGNYFWVNLDRDHAVSYYQRALDAFPGSKDVVTATWRITWTAYLERRPEASQLLEEFAQHFPSSTYMADALYWLGRSEERAGNLPLARSFFLADAGRFPQTYFGRLAAGRTAPAPDGIGDAPVDPPAWLAQIPQPPVLASIDAPLPPEAEPAVERAQALESIAFYSSAEDEYRAAYDRTHAAVLLLDEANVAIAAGHYSAAMVVGRQLLQGAEARQLVDAPIEAWRAAYPLPFEDGIQQYAAENHLDPMLVAGQIRQESAFDPEAISRAGAVGLLQLEPATARKLARSLHIGYSRARLRDPEYNLRLGTLYLAGLIAAYGTPEAALAAYDAGEDRVVMWTAGQTYQETAEFVESIPFTETREYVQVVLRNAELYRKIYSAALGQETAQGGIK
jgi:soluble lytic murein transglycosylase